MCTVGTTLATLGRRRTTTASLARRVRVIAVAVAILQRMKNVSRENVDGEKMP